MTSVRDRGRLRHERSSATPSVAPPDSSIFPESDDKLSDQPAGPLGTKSPIANTLAAAINIPKYPEDDLQQILKTVLEARVSTPAPVLAPTPAPAPATIVAKILRKKLKAHSPDIYYKKSHMDCYNFR